MFEFPLQGGIEGEILQPFPAVQAKGGELLGERGKLGLFQPLPGQSEHLLPPLKQQAVIHGGRVASPVAADLVRREQAFLFQQVQVDEIGVARLGGQALIGRIAVAGGAQGQQLPPALAGFVQSVQKSPGRPAHSAYAIGRGQGKQGQQHAAFTAQVRFGHGHQRQHKLLILKFMLIKERVETTGGKNLTS